MAMTRLPIDTQGLSFICAGQPEPCVEFGTDRAKTDEAGTQLYQVAVVAMFDGTAEVLAIKVPGEPKGLTQGAPVKPVGLTAWPWHMGDRWGVAYRAARVDPVTPTRAAS